MAPDNSGRSDFTSVDRCPAGDPDASCRDWYIVRYSPGRSVAAEARLMQRSAAVDESLVQDALETGLRDVPRSAAPAALELLELGARLFVPMTFERQLTEASTSKRRGLRGKYRRRTDRRWIWRRLPACPGYLFVCAPSDALLSAICRANYVETVLKGAGDKPVETEPKLMAALLGGMLEQNPDFRSSRFSRGDRVEVSKGPLHELEGMIAKTSSGDRLTVLMDIFGAERSVSVPTQYVRKVD